MRKQFRGDGDAVTVTEFVFSELSRTMTGYVTSDVDGNVLNLLDPNRISDSVANA